MDYVLVPIHHSGNHWTTAVIDMKNKRIDYYDSLLGNNPKCFLVRGQLRVACMHQEGQMRVSLTVYPVPVMQ